MLCKYKYRCLNQKHFGRCGWYQADTDDFKSFFKSARPNLLWVGVELADGSFWYWHSNSSKWGCGSVYKKYVE